MRWLAVGVVEEDEVSDLHVISHHVARLIVPHTIPMGRTICDQLFPGVDFGLTLHQPVVDHHYDPDAEVF